MDALYRPPAQPHEYTIRFFKPGQPGEMTEGDKVVDVNARAWLYAAGFSREVGNALVERITKVVERKKGMDTRQLY